VARAAETQTKAMAISKIFFPNIQDFHQIFTRKTQADTDAADAPAPVAPPAGARATASFEEVKPGGTGEALLRSPKLLGIRWNFMESGDIPWIFLFKIVVKDLIFIDCPH
jgi:hypothetical protein